MKHNKSSANFLIIPLISLAVVGVFILILFPDFVPDSARLLLWIGVGAATLAAGGLWMRANAAKKRAAEKIEEERRRKRVEQRNKEREEQEARRKAAQEKAAQKEAERVAKRTEEKEAMVKVATTVWAERTTKALAQGTMARKVLAQATKMSVRTAAGQMATEWGEAATLAQWTSQQIIALTDRPDVKTEAREEAREAIMEAARIRERGGVWTEAQGEALKDIKEKAREEARRDEERLDSVRDVMQKAEAEWKIAEARATRLAVELKEIMSGNGA